MPCSLHLVCVSRVLGNKQHNSSPCVFELPSTTQAQNDYRPQQKASSRPSLACLVAIALGLLNVILTSLLLYQWILCQVSNYFTCASCPHCPDLWMRHGNHCYYFSMKKMDWNSSLYSCLAEDSDLLMITDDQEMHSYSHCDIAASEDLS